jgi:hypothetical protein
MGTATDGFRLLPGSKLPSAQESGRGQYVIAVAATPLAVTTGASKKGSEATGDWLLAV